MPVKDKPTSSAWADWWTGRRFDHDGLRHRELQQPRQRHHPSGCRTGGFSGHNLGTIWHPGNTGAIIGNVTVDGTNLQSRLGLRIQPERIAHQGCIGNGLSATRHWQTSATAPAAMHTTAVCHKQSNYDTEENTVDWSLPAYYDWELKQSVQLTRAQGRYTYYEFTNLPLQDACWKST